jgi:hypothetical protein
MCPILHHAPKSDHAPKSHDALCEKPQACQCDVREMEWLAREALALTSDKEGSPDITVGQGRCGMRGS